MADLDAYAPDYATARRRFREATAKLGWETLTFPTGETGPDGEELTIDLADSGGDRARTLVVSSGLHGVEGPFGSAVQLAALDRWAKAGPPAVRCLFLHALNPYGFAWSRRTDDENVDPNRNFLSPRERYEGAPRKYAALDALLNPPHPPSAWRPLLPFALLAIARHGMPALRQAVAGGQYEFPKGLFFGGKEPGATYGLLDKKLPALLEGSGDLLHLDYHTGLGDFGRSKLLVGSKLTDAGRRALVEWFGDEAVSTTKDAAYEARGGFGDWCRAAAQGFAKNYLFACAEFGTFGPLKVLAALRAENQAHHWGTPDASSTKRAKERIREAFCPKSPTWRERALTGGLDLIDRGIGGLAGKGA